MQTTTIPAQRRIIEKIRSIDELPTYAEAKALLELFARGHGDYHAGEWDKFCSSNSVYNIWNTEFLDALAQEVRRLHNIPIVEICAGNGKLSHHLRRREINIKPTGRSTDIYVPFVDNLYHDQALEEYEPSVVIASWPHGSEISHDVMNFHTVQHYIHIGNTDMCGADESIFARDDFEHRNLRNVEKFSIGRTDYYKGIYHNHVWLFSRK
jgi:hypothetical protein